MEIKNIGIIGAGTMGSAIAYLMAYNGLNVKLVDVDTKTVERGISNIRKISEMQIGFNKRRPEKEISRIEKLGIKLTEEQKDTIKRSMDSIYDEKMGDSVMGRIRPTESYSELSQCQMVIEVAFENMTVKKGIIEKLNPIMKGDAILASNSSSLSVTEMSKNFSHPENFILTHFFNPPYTLPLVEIVRGMMTSENTFNETINFFKSLRNHRGPMKPVAVKEVPGFLVNRILVPMINEAFMMLDENVASARDIDEAMKAGAGMPMGPLELADMVGIDVTYDVMEILYREYGDSKYRPSILLKKYKNAGKLGRKNGNGVYDY
ncbi:MAG: 3-hydroxyacyl-CoA dehydrogenase family protein [Cuniculiplasma sp.]